MTRLSSLNIVAASLATLAAVSGQQAGTLSTEYHIPVPLTTCTAPGACTTETDTSVTLDANWRWLHNTGGSTNCYTGTSWSTDYCPDPTSCANNCALEGVTSSQWANPYGVTTAPGGVQLQFVTGSGTSANVGSRMFLLDANGQYHLFKLKNREFTFTVDVSTLQCGLNGALYFVAMDADGGASKYPSNKAGAAYGTGYCDSQCPQNIKFIEGQANILNWSTSTASGEYGTCCGEIDIWEANMFNSQFTMHPCDTVAPSECQTSQTCGVGADRYSSVCDKDGCDFGLYRLGNPNFYGPGSSYTIDTTQPIQVVTQFITNDGTDTGTLSEIRRFYVQNGRVISNPEAAVNGLPAFNSISDSTCTKQKTLFGDQNIFGNKGGMSAVSSLLDRGLVLVLSLWDDTAVNMLWLDSVLYPPTATAGTPGSVRGPCPVTSGVPATLQANFPNAYVKFENIVYGAIDSTFSAATSPTTTPAPPCTSAPVAVGSSCAATPTCCPAATPTCYLKDQSYAGCLSSCAAGIHADDPPGDQTPWACTVLGTAAGATPAPPVTVTPPTVAPVTVAPTVAQITQATTVNSNTGSAQCGAPGGCASVIEPYGSCLQAPSCCAIGTTCFEQSSCYAQCLPICPPTGWSCAILGGGSNAYNEVAAPANVNALNNASGASTVGAGVNFAGVVVGVVCAVVVVSVAAAVLRRRLAATRGRISLPAGNV